ncbi:MAG: hypothetical protein K6T83_19495, partial [Alicyclobacillus sp.]|nr:hypothetical protein [Alicyclobacillus sp.]
NGSIDVRRSIHPGCDSLYAATHNGRIDIDGIAEGVLLEGTAKTFSGKVDIAGPNLEVELTDPEHRRYARFRTTRNDSVDNQEKPANVYLETHNGTVFLRG